MKKRFISLLLTVLMVLSLFSGLTVNAYAATNAYGANTIEYTMGQGDYVLRICQKLGLNYYTCKDAIQILNNIYDGQWNKLTVGRVLTLPASDADAVLIASGARQTPVNTGASATTLSTVPVVTGTATTGTVSTANTATFNSSAASSADTLNYYLVPYTMSYGETVSGVCNNLGVNFSVFSPFIKQVNNITNWNKVRAGDTILVPTPVCPSVGTTCYGVMQHIVKSSDTAYGIVSSKGINYNANEQLLKVLNQTDNLAALKAGGNFFYPVPLTVSVPGTGNPGATATTTTTTTVTDGNGTTTTQTTTTAKLYKLTSGMSASDGTMIFYVNNQPVTAAPAGAKVTVVTSTNSGKAIQSMTVKQSDGKADFLLTGDTFVMPACDVRVDTSIKAGHDITIEANYSGKATATVGGVTVQAAVKGATVVVKSADPNYEISSIYVYYRKLVSSATKTEVKHSSTNAFIMPDMPVTIEVMLKPVATYAFYVNDPMNGSFYLKVNGSPVTRAAKGAEVTIVTTPDAGYVPGLITVTKHGDPTKFINFFNNSFTMPGYDVDVNVTFFAKGNNIVILPAQGGDAVAYAADGLITPTVDPTEEIDERGSNEWVALKDKPDTGYVLDTENPYDVVRTSDGLKVNVSKHTESGVVYYIFRMPKGGVTVTPHFIGQTDANIYADIKIDGVSMTTYSNASFSITVDGKKGEFQKTGDHTGSGGVLNRTLKNGESVDLRYDCSDGLAFVQYTIHVLSGGSISTNPADKLLSEELTNAANIHGYFEMPNRDIQIVADFERGSVPIGPAVITGTGSVGYKVWDAYAIPPQWKSANSCEAGQEVMIIVTSGNGFKFDATRYDTKLKVFRKDNGAPVTISTISVPTLDPNSYAFTFEMPSSGVDVQAVFDAKPFVITMKCLDEVGNDLTGMGYWQAAIDWVPGIVDNHTNYNWFTFAPETKFNVSYGDYVTVAMTEAGWSKYDMVSFRINDLEYTADQLNYFYNFQMIDDRAKDLTITAVMRPKTVSAIHNLIAMYDVTKGGVEFMIVDSPSTYSNEFRYNSAGALNYVNKAIAGDKVAIVVNSVDDKYTVKAKDINIMGWGTDADRIIPTESWILANGTPSVKGAPGAIHVFTFTMPDSDVSVTVNYTGKQQGMMISVYDMDNNPVSGMVRLFAGNIARDVASPASFDDIPYKTPVTITRSELALAETKVIKDVDIHTDSGKSINYTDMSNAGEGIQFIMPDEPVWVIIRMDDFHVNAPTVVIDTQVVGGVLYFRKSDNATDPIASLTDFAPGETVYVFDEPLPGFDHLGIGDLKIFVNGMQNALNIQEVANRPHVWSFTMPSGTIILKADFPLEEEDEVMLSVVINPASVGGKDTEVDVTINGYTFTMNNSSAPFKVYEGDSVMITSATEGYTVKTLQSASMKGVTDNVYVVPDLSEATPKFEDTLTVNLSAEGFPIEWSTSKGGSLNVTSGGASIVSAKAGDMITVIATPDTNYHVVDGIITLTSATDETQINLSEDTPGSNTWTFPMPADGLKITADFETNDEVLVTFAVVGPTDAQAKLSMSAGDVTMTAGSSNTWKFETGTVITVTPVGDYKAKLSSASGKGVSGSKYTVNAANGLSDTVTITLSISAEPVTLKVTSDTKLGSISLTHSNSKAVAEPASAFKTGDTLYFFDSPVTGYELDSVKVVENLSGTEYTIKNGGIVKDTTTGCYEIVGVSSAIPVDGVTITASFKAKTVNLNFSGNGQVRVYGLSAEYTVDAASAPTVQFKFGETVNLTPAGDFKWGTATVDGTAIGGTTKQFKISSEGPISVVIAP